ncbi:trichohyalin isoform X1 [Hydra vulgaris]|uniref:trichohyalin isoform X1 n=2 Tax=Hydra vulgaris TaxID=6087 RepID=UPI00064139F1|nr:trichohyalin [Hydra vulgaris]
MQSRDEFSQSPYLESSFHSKKSKKSKKRKHERRETERESGEYHKHKSKHKKNRRSSSSKHARRGSRRSSTGSDHLQTNPEHLHPLLLRQNANFNAGIYPTYNSQDPMILRSPSVLWPVSSMTAGPAVAAYADYSAYLQNNTSSPISLAALHDAQIGLGSPQTIGTRVVATPVTLSSTLGMGIPRALSGSYLLGESDISYGIQSGANSLHLNTQHCAQTASNIWQMRQVTSILQENQTKQITKIEILNNDSFVPKSTANDTGICQISPAGVPPQEKAVKEEPNSKIKVEQKSKDKVIVKENSVVASSASEIKLSLPSHSSPSTATISLDKNPKETSTSFIPQQHVLNNSRPQNQNSVTSQPPPNFDPVKPLPSFGVQHPANNFELQHPPLNFDPKHPHNFELQKVPFNPMQQFDSQRIPHNFDIRHPPPRFDLMQTPPNFDSRFPPPHFNPRCPSQNFDPYLPPNRFDQPPILPNFNMQNPPNFDPRLPPPKFVPCGPPPNIAPRSNFNPRQVIQQPPIWPSSNFDSHRPPLVGRPPGIINQDSAYRHPRFQPPGNRFNMLRNPMSPTPNRFNNQNSVDFFPPTSVFQGNPPSRPNEHFDVQMQNFNQNNFNAYGDKVKQYNDQKPYENYSDLRDEKKDFSQNDQFESLRYSSLGHDHEKYSIGHSSNLVQNNMRQNEFEKYPSDSRERFFSGNDVQRYDSSRYNADSDLRYTGYNESKDSTFRSGFLQGNTNNKDKENSFESNHYDDRSHNTHPLSNKDIEATDYSIIVKALRTLSSSNTPVNEQSPVAYSGDGFEPVSPARSDPKEKKSKKKKHKKEKKKDLKKKLQEKLAELATLNEQSDNLADNIQSKSDQEGEKKDDGKNSSLSIQFSAKPSKMNIKLHSPIVKGNVFQKYKNQMLKSESPIFPTKHIEHGDRKYRKVAESGKEENPDDAQKSEDANDPQTKEDLLKMLGINTAFKEKRETFSGSEDGEVLSDDEVEERLKIKEKQAKQEEDSCVQIPLLEPSSTIDVPSNISKQEKKDNGEQSSDGELSTDGELSSDDDGSDDSLDEFGRSKKLRFLSGDNNGYSSASESSENSDDERARWGQPESQSSVALESFSRSKSRSVSVSPVPSAVILENSEDLEKLPVIEAQLEEVPLKTKEEIEKEKVLLEQLELEKKREAAEKERLRLEVSQLESKIDKNLIARGRQREDKSESSATDISDEENEIEIKDSNVGLPIPESSSELLRLKLEEKIKEKELEVIKVKEVKCKIEKKVDMFADSGEEDQEKDEIVAESNEQPMEVDLKDGDVQSAVNPVTVCDNNSSITTLMQDEKSKEWNDKDDEFERTLKSLQEIRNTMETMTKEELENALKLHSLDTIKIEADDGRKTPLHLRDIEIPIKSLTEYVGNHRLLFKQIFRNINKKEFKHMLPKSLLKYDIKMVRNWCFDEIEIISKKRLRAILLQQYLASSSSESEDETEDIKKTETDKNKEVVVEDKETVIEDKEVKKVEKKKKKKNKKLKKHKKSEDKLEVTLEKEDTCSLIKTENQDESKNLNKIEVEDATETSVCGEVDKESESDELKNIKTQEVIEKEKIECDQTIAKTNENETETKEEQIVKVIDEKCQADATPSETESEDAESSSSDNDNESEESKEEEKSNSSASESSVKSSEDESEEKGSSDEKSKKKESSADENDSSDEESSSENEEELHKKNRNQKQQKKHSKNERKQKNIKQKKESSSSSEAESSSDSDKKVHRSEKNSSIKSKPSSKNNENISITDQKRNQIRERYLLEKERRLREKDRRIRELMKRKRRREKEESEEETEEEDDDEEEEEEDEKHERKQRNEKNKQEEKERRKRNTRDADNRSKKQQDSSDLNSSSNSSDGEGNEDETSYRNQMKTPSGRQTDEKRRHYAKYIAHKRKQQQQEMEKIDLRRKLTENAQQQARDLTIHEKELIFQREAEKPEGYDERKRRREMECGKGHSNWVRRSGDDDLRRRTNQQDLNRHSISGHVHIPKYEQQSHDKNRSISHDKMDRKRLQDTSRSRGHDSNESLTRDKSRDSLNKRTVLRSDSRDANKRRKERGSSSEKSEVKPASDLRELEFRARALQSLLDKTEKSNRAKDSRSRRSER